MKCPYCANSETQVLDSRVSEEGDVVRRRRRCQACDRRFTTYERVELSMPVVVKRDGTRSEFDPNKFQASMRLALRKRPVTAELFEESIDRIQENMLNRGVKEISTQEIGEVVLSELKHLDQVAYVRYASVYKSFCDINEFVQAIQEMKDQQ